MRLSELIDCEIKRIISKTWLPFTFLFVISIFCVAFILELIKDKNNLLLVLLIYLNNPQITIYHKYYDPLLFVMLLTIFKLNIQEENLFKKNSLIFFYFFSSSFLLLSYFK